MTSTDDRHQIIDQLNLLAALFDARDWARIGEVLHPDVDGYGCRGIDAVVNDSLRHHLGGCGPSQHLLANYQIQVDGDSARSATKARVFHRGEGERANRTFECFGDYHDDWVRTPHGWRMIGRRFDVSMSFGDFDVLQPG
jgi:SnoaL-like domain